MDFEEFLTLMTSTEKYLEALGGEYIAAHNTHTTHTQCVIDSVVYNCR